MIDFFKVGDRKYDVSIKDIEETFNILYTENTGRTMSENARMSLDPIGTFYGHKVTVRRKRGKEKDFDNLYNYISKPRYDGINIKIVHGQETISYDAYVSSGGRKASRIDQNTNMVYWDEFVINFTPMEAQVLPDE